MNDALKGAIIAIVSSLPIAMLFALLYRFPIPIVGYIGPFADSYVDNPIDHANDIINIATVVSMAWFVYGMSGGFIILSVGGAITGKIISSKYSGLANKRQKNILVIICGIIIAILSVGLLSTLEYIIGPW
jgi:hypothetical protein